MHEKIIEFMKIYFHKEGDCCPTEEIDIFIRNNFEEKDRKAANAYINQLIDDGDLKLINNDHGEYLSVTAKGTIFLI